MAKRRPVTPRQVVELLARLERAVEVLNKTSVEDLREAGQHELRLVMEAWEREQFFDESGAAKPIAPFGEKWQKRKEAKGFDMRRGHADAKGLAAVVGSPQSMHKIEDGYRINIAELQGHFVNYWRAMREAKAPGMLLFKKDWKKRHARKVAIAAGKFIAAALGEGASFNEKTLTVTFRGKLRLDYS